LIWRGRTCGAEGGPYGYRGKPAVSAAICVYDFVPHRLCPIRDRLAACLIVLRALHLATGGPAYWAFTVFFLEASVFGMPLFNRSRVPHQLDLLSIGMLALGTTPSAFRIMANDSWMEAAVGCAVE
jgi:hypothetical protein